MGSSEWPAEQVAILPITKLVSINNLVDSVYAYADFNKIENLGCWTKYEQKSFLCWTWVF